MKNAIAPTHASKTFLIKMFLVFLDLTEPAHNIANPACIKNTSPLIVAISALTATSSSSLSSFAPSSLSST
ncbi:unnamed protein product [Bathycoccus prasinos]